MLVSALIISLKTALISTVLALFLSLPLALYFTQRKNIFTKIAECILIFPMFFPPSGIGYFLLITLNRKSGIGKFLWDNFNIHLIFNWWSAVIATFFVIVPIVYLNIKSGFLGIEKSYIEAGKEMGAGKLQLFFHIQLPLIKKNIVIAFLLGIGRALGEFGATILVAGNIEGKTQTLSLALYSSVEQGNQSNTKLILLLICSLSLTILIFYNYFMTKSYHENLVN